MWIAEGIKLWMKQKDLIPRLVDASDATPEGKDDYDSMAFKKKIVLFAKRTGRSFRTETPTDSDENTLKAYKAVKQDMASFRLQIVAACSKHCSDVFVGNDKDVIDHPFRGFIEWRLLERSFNPHQGNVLVDYYWQELDEVMNRQLVLDDITLKQHMKDIANVRNNLLNHGISAEHIDSTFMLTLMTQLKRAQGSENDLDARMEWIAEAATWNNAYNDDKSSMPWETLRRKVENQASNWKSTGQVRDSSYRNKAPRISATTPPGVALYSGEDIAYYVKQALNDAGLSAAPNNTPQRGQIRCNKCGGLGHIAAVCPTGEDWPARQTKPGQGRPFAGGGSGRPFAGGGRGGSAAGGGQGRPFAGGGRGQPQRPPQGRGRGTPGGAKPQTPFPTTPLSSVVGHGHGLVTDDGTNYGCDGAEYTHDDHYADADAEQAGAEDYQEDECLSAVPFHPGRAAAKGAELLEDAYITIGRNFGPSDDSDGQHVFADGQAFRVHNQAALSPPCPIPEESVLCTVEPFDSDLESKQPGVRYAPDDPIFHMNKTAPPFNPQRRLTPPWMKKVRSAVATAFDPSSSLDPHDCSGIDFVKGVGSTVSVLGSSLRSLHRPRNALGTSLCALAFACITMPLIMASLADCHPIDSPARNSSSFDVAFSSESQIAFGAVSSSMGRYYVDSGCSTTIVSNPKFLKNIRQAEAPTNIAGYNGSKTLDMRGDLHLPVKAEDGSQRDIVLPYVHYDPCGHINLISTDDIKKTHWDVNFSWNPQREGLFFFGPNSNSWTAKVNMTEHGKLRGLPLADSSSKRDDPDQDHAHFSAKVGNMSLEELFHLRMGHASLGKLAALNDKVHGLPRMLHMSKLLHLPCACCDEAKAKRQNYPPASQTVYKNEDDIMTWDLFDMGQDWLTVDGNRYLSIFIIGRSRTAFTILHDSRRDFKSVVKQAFVRAGFTPKTIRCDGAGEYIKGELYSYLRDDCGINVQFSNPREQFQNGISEKFVDTLGKSIRTMLLQSHLPPAFWGCAAHLATDLYNHLPHSSIDNNIPIAMHTNQTPDVSWFRPFGCQATLFRGRDIVEHHKLAPRGVTGIHVGLGASHGRKCWLVWVPSLGRIYASRNVAFDETLFPMKKHDQRVFGLYDNESVDRMRAEAYNEQLDYVPLQDILDMPMPQAATSKTLSFNPLPDDEICADHVQDSAPPHPALNNTQDRGGTRDRGGGTQVRGGEMQDRGGDEGIAHRGGAHEASRPQSRERNDNQSLPPPNQFRSSRPSVFNDADVQYGNCTKFWWSCENQLISDTTDEDLREFIIGSSLPLKIPADYYPRDKISWCGEAYDVVDDDPHFGKVPAVKLLLSPTGRSKIKKRVPWAVFPISHHGTGIDVSVRRALAHTFPHAKTCADLVGRKTAPEPTAAPPHKRPKTRLHVKKGQTANDAPCLFAFGAMEMLTHAQSDYRFTSAFHAVEPKNWKEARRSNMWEGWQKAEHTELKTIWDMETFEIVDTPPGVIPLPSQLVYKVKRDKYGEIARLKARLVACGNFQSPWEYHDTYSPTARFSALRTITAIATQENLDLFAFDVEGAFMTSYLDTDVYMSLPPGYSLPPGKTIKLRKSLYGLKQSSNLYFANITRWLHAYGFQEVSPDGCVFKLQRGEEKLILSLYVDDGVVATNSKKLYDKFMQDLGKEFKLSESSDLSWYLGVDFQRDRTRGNLTLSQERYIEQMLERFCMEDCNPSPTPATHNQRMTKEHCPPVPDKDQVKLYQQLVGALLWCATVTRPDISHAVGQCAKFMSNPAPEHVIAARMILKYLKGTKSLTLTYSQLKGPQANTLVCFADADHAGCPDTKRSTTGYTVFLAGACVSWSSKRQAVCSLSTAEAEYYAASESGVDITYLRRLMCDMGYEQKEPTILWEDNMACIFMSRTSVMYTKARHIDTKVYRLRELCKEGKMILHKVGTEDQVADALTKALAKHTFNKHRDVMLGLRAWELNDQELETFDEDTVAEIVKYIKGAPKTEFDILRNLSPKLCEAVEAALKKQEQETATSSKKRVRFADEDGGDYNDEPKRRKEAEVV